MAFDPFEVNSPHLAYTLLGGFIVIYGLFSLFLKEKLYIGEAPIALGIGIALGPYALGFFDPYSWGGGKNDTVTDQITLEVTRIVIAISVFAVGVELPKAYMKRHWRSLAFLLGPGMLWAWFISALLIWGLVPGLNFLSSLVIAAAVTPTDPILAQAVIGGRFADKHVPAHIRHILSAESGCNDGAAFPFLGIALYLTLEKSTGHAIGKWFYYTIAYEIILGVVLGSLLGFVARKSMKYAEKKRLIDRQSYVAQYVSLAVLATGGTALLGSDDLLSAFACGTAFAWDGFFNKATEDAVFSNVIDLLFNCAAFIYIGAFIPFDQFQQAASGLTVWRLVVLAICILLFRRLPVILALYRWIPDIKTFREAAFTGWFGPMGVGAIFIGTLARTELPEGPSAVNAEQVELLRATILPVVSFLVLSSVICHGMSIPFFSLGRRVHSITYTWTRNTSLDTRRDNEPAWTTHARRIQPGEEIVINRDDDAEEGDLGLRRRDTTLDEPVKEKKRPQIGSDDSGGSSSSRTVAITGEENEKKQPESGIDEEKREPSNRQEGDGDDDAIGDANADEDVYDGSRTPPLAQFREGDHLIIERRTGDDGEVEVEVVRNHFHDDKPSESSMFKHPHRLKMWEVEEIAQHLPHSLEHAVLRVENGGKEAIDPMGLGLMRGPSNISSGGTRISRRTATPEPTRGQTDAEAEREARSDDSAEEEDAGAPAELSRTRSSRTSSPPPSSRRIIPDITINSGKKVRSSIAALFGRGKSRPSSPTPSIIEEGRVSEPGLLSPPTSPRPRRPREPAPSQSDRSIPLTRTTSNAASRAIRFAENLSPSSHTAPGLTNYGNQAPGFKKNPSLSLFRTSSLHSEDGGEGDDGGEEAYIRR